MNTQSKLVKVLSLFGLGLVFMGVGLVLGQNLELDNSGSLISPFISQEKKESLPLLKYSIPNLITYDFQAKSPLKVEKIIEKTETHTSYLFSYTTTGRKITGQLNIPTARGNTPTVLPLPSIVLLRGWVPIETYSSGVGTKNAAAAFAEEGYITLAPDFLGYGGSDPELEDSWENRFIKPIHVIELIQTIQEHPSLSFQNLTDQDKKLVPASLSDVKLDPSNIGMWAHSNGGQIALSSLEVLSQTEILAQPITTTLWAPVTAPFPYSLLFFSDESEDEGKATRKWISLFEEKYDVYDFTLTQHLDKLVGPLQLHHGTADEAALVAWSEEFVEKIERENQRRETKKLSENLESSASAQETDDATVELLDPIEIEFFTYPNADHNLQPGWNTAIQRDIAFFNRTLR